MVANDLYLGSQQLVARAVPKEVLNWRLIVLVLTASFGGACYGYDIGFIGGVLTLPAFETSFGTIHETTSQTNAISSNIVSAFQAGAIFGCVAAANVADRYGRRLAIILSAALYVIGSTICTAASGASGVNMLIGGRVLNGLGVGAISLLVPVYVAEASPPNFRGRFVGTFEIFIQISTALGFWINYIFQQSVSARTTAQFRGPQAVQLVFGTVLLAGMCFLTETPRFLVKAHSKGRGLSTLAYLRNLPEDHPYVQDEFSAIIRQIELEKLDARNISKLKVLKESFGPRLRGRLLIGTLLFFFQQFSGTSAINYYTPTIFGQLGLKGSSVQLVSTGAYGLIRMTASMILMIFVMDRVGRRTLIIVGLSLMSVFMWLVGAMIAVYPAKVDEPTKPGQYAAVVFIFTWSVAYCFSISGIPWVYCSEIFPTYVRAFCMAFATCLHWIFNLIIAKAGPYLISSTGYGTYIFFASWTTIGAIWAYFFLPETRGVPLESMDALFGHPIQVDGELGYEAGVGHSSLGPRPEDDEKGDLHHAEGSTRT